MSSAKLYHEYIGKFSDRIDLFELLIKNLEIKRALYPGSYIDITPSFFFPLTVYIETYKKANEFFGSKDLIEFIEKEKRYKNNPVVRFYNSDYRKKIDESESSFDLLISLYAGFVSKYCKRYLKLGGFLLANNTHGDASMARLDGQFKLSAVIYKSNRKLYLSEKNLDNYFIPKKNIKVTVEYLENLTVPMIVEEFLGAAVT